MTGSATGGTLRGVPRLAYGHIRFFGMPLAVPEPDWFLDGASGIVSNAEDLARWLMMHNNGGQAANGTQVISAAGLAEMHEGLGWSSRTREGRREIEHPGWMFTFTAHQVLLPDSGYGVAVIANSWLSLATADSNAIANALVNMTEGKTAEPGPPVAMVVDVVLAALTLVAIVFGVRALRRARIWAARNSSRPLWRNRLAFVPWLIPAAILAMLPATLKFLFRGRDASLLQMYYVAPRSSRFC